MLLIENKELTYLRVENVARTSIFKIKSFGKYFVLQVLVCPTNDETRMKSVLKITYKLLFYRRKVVLNF